MHTKRIRFVKIKSVDPAVGTIALRRLATRLARFDGNISWSVLIKALEKEYYVAAARQTAKRMGVSLVVKREDSFARRRKP